MHRYLTALSDLPDLCHVSPNSGGSCYFSPECHIPRSSEDPVFTSFAQLGAFRLNGSRSMISLLDSTRQYVLAEATPTLSLQNDSASGTGDALLLGAAIIPRARGICEQVVSWQVQSDTGNANQPSPDTVLVVNDISEDERSRYTPIAEFLNNRSYVGVPIISPKGIVVGVYCVFGTEPRNEVGSIDRQFLCDMSKTVMNYLSMCTLREDHRRKEQLLRGLGSFVQGMSALEDYELVESPQSPGLNERGEQAHWDFRSENPQPEAQRVSIAHKNRTLMPLHVQPLVPIGGDGFQQSLREDQAMSTASATNSFENTRTDPVDQFGRQRSKTLEESAEPRDTLQPKGAKDLYSRAANVIRQSSDLSGVAFLDASLAIQPGKFRTQKIASATSDAHQGQSAGGTTTDTTSSESERKTSDEWATDNKGTTSDRDASPPTRQRNPCSVLAYSVNQRSSSQDKNATPSEVSLPEADLRALLRRYPNGTVLHFDASGNFASSDGSGSSSDESGRNTVAARRPKKSITGNESERAKLLNTTIGNVATGARSVAILPIWHHEQERWSAVAFCWTTDEHRLLSYDRELLFLRIFGDNIMNGLARLEALISERAKTTFLSSISHELRSPLHGILGSSEFLMETNVDSFQADMVSSIEQCGRTLLDTIDSVLSFTKINDFTQSKSRSAVARGHRSGIQRGSKPQNRALKLLNSPLVKDLDLSIVTEEVVEAVFASQSFRICERGSDVASENHDLEDDPTEIPQLLERSRDGSRKRVRITLDMPRDVHWVFKAQPGAWRRIIMNVVGNSLKFTDTGFISITVRTQEIPTDPDVCKVKLTVADSGRGISRDYLKSKLFTPFSQQDSFTPGTGLGLSIVRQIVDTMSGDIDVQSEEGIGTTVKIVLTLPKGESVEDSTSRLKRTKLTTVTDELQNLKVCVLDKTLPLTNENASTTSKRHHRHGFLLAETMKSWLNVDVIYADTWTPGIADIVFCPEPSFENLALMQNVENPKMVPQVVFVCLDAIESSALRHDARIASAAKPVEIITQP